MLRAQLLVLLWSDYAVNVNINLLTVKLGKDISMESSSSDDTILLEELELETNSSQGNFVIFDILDWF